IEDLCSRAVADARDERVITVPAVQGIGPIPAIEDVVATRPAEVVIAPAAADRVGEITASEGVLAGAKLDVISLDACQRIGDSRNAAPGSGDVELAGIDRSREGDARLV